MQYHKLKFAPQPIHTAVKSYGHELDSATVRYDDERNISAGDYIEITKPHGITAEKWITVGYAKVLETKTIPANQVLDYLHDFDIEYGFESYDNFIAALRDYYGASITATTEVKVIVYRTVALAK